MSGATEPDPILNLLQKPEYQALVQRIRQFMRDYGEINRLNQEQESSDRDILLAVSLTIDDINFTPPPLTKTLEAMVQAGWTPLVVVGAVIRLLQTLVLHYDRNYLPFNDGGIVTEGLSAKSPRYHATIDRLSPWYESYKLKTKTSANLAEMMGVSPSGVPSEFSLIHGLE